MNARCRWVHRTVRGHGYAWCAEPAIPLERFCCEHLIAMVAAWDEHARLRVELQREREAS